MKKPVILGQPQPRQVDPIQTLLGMNNQLQHAHRGLSTEFHLKWEALMKAIEKHNPALVKAYGEALAEETGYRVQEGLEILTAEGNLNVIRLQKERIDETRRGMEADGLLDQFEFGRRRRILEALEPEEKEGEE